MPVRRQGRYVETTPDELNAWLGKESGEPVHVATEDTDLTAELKRGLSFVRREKPSKPMRKVKAQRESNSFVDKEVGFKCLAKLSGRQVALTALGAGGVTGSTAAGLFPFFSARRCKFKACPVNHHAGVPLGSCSVSSSSHSSALHDSTAHQCGQLHQRARDRLRQIADTVFAGVPTGKRPATIISASSQASSVMKVLGAWLPFLPSCGFSL
jgi:hypothetical protein